MMKAYIVSFHWNLDASVISNIVMYGYRKTDIQKSAETLHPGHTVMYVERAKWLDKP
jgi:hypothetical protein